MSDKGKTSMPSTLAEGSEEDFDVICDPCNSEGQRVQAAGHCIDCNVNMCVSCLKFHKKLPVVKDHVTKDKSTLSQSQKTKMDKMTVRCIKHPAELLKFYCKKHQTICCSVCVSLDHRSCKRKDIFYIRDVSGGITNSDELKKIQADLQMLVTRLTNAKSHTKWIKDLVTDSHSQTVSDIRNLKREIIERLDQLENEILEHASRMCNEKVDELDSVITDCETMIGHTEKIIADMEMEKRMNHNVTLFISVKRTQRSFPDLGDKVNKLCKHSKYEELSFKPNENLRKALSTLGDMQFVSKTTYSKAKYHQEFIVKCATDTGDCAINGIIALPDRRLALTDFKNKSVKLVDATHSKVSEQCKLESNPLDLTYIGKDKIAVNLENKLYIQVLSVSPSLSKCYAITVPSLYRGIEYIPDKFILVCKDPVPAVHICDMSGVLLQQIETDYCGNRLLTRPSRIATSPDHGVMYITDRYQHTVVSLTTDGKLISKYTSKKLKVPIGIAVSDDGYVYVCSYDSQSVHMLSPGGQLVKILLEERDGIKLPVAMAHSARDLFVSSYAPTDCNSIQVYRLGN